MDFSVRGYAGMKRFAKNPVGKVHEPAIGKTALQIYRKKLSKLAPLTPEQELELFKAFSEGDAEARDTIIEHNLRFVEFIINKHKLDRFGTDLEDLIEEGNVGLIKAVDRFDYKKGYKFTTYAEWYIRQAIEDSIYKKNRLIRLPKNVADTISSYLTAKRSIETKTPEGGEPVEATLEEIAHFMHTTPQRVAMYADFAENFDPNKMTRLDEVIHDDEGGEREHHETIEDPNLADIEKQQDDEIRRKVVKKWLGRMTPIEQEIIKAYYFDELEIGQIATKFNAHRNAVRDALNKAETTLRYFARQEGIDREDIL